MKSYEEILRTSLEPITDALLTAGPDVYLICCALSGVFHEDAYKMETLYAYVRARKPGMPRFGSTTAQFMAMMERGRAVSTSASLTALMTASTEIQRLEVVQEHWLPASRRWASWAAWFCKIAGCAENEEARRIAVVACSVFEKDAPDPYLATTMFAVLTDRMEPKAQDLFYQMFFKNLTDTETAHDDRARSAR